MLQIKDRLFFLLNKILDINPLTRACFMVFFLSFLTIWVWFYEGKLIFSADTAFPLDPELSFKNFFYTWKDEFSGGNVDATGVALIPYYFFILVLKLIGLNLLQSQAFFFFILLLLSGIGVLFLFKNISEKLYFWPIFIPAIFYMFNLYVALNAWKPQINLYIFYAFLPFLILIFIKYIEKNRNYVPYFVYFSIISSLFLSSSFTNVSYLVVLSVILSAVSIALFINNRISFSFLSKKILIAAIIWLPLNAWYLMPQFSALADTTLKATGGNFEGSINILKTVSANASVLNLLNIQGFHALYDQAAGEWFEWANLYTSSHFKLLAFTLPFLLCLFVFKFKKIKNKSYSAMALMFIFFGVLLSNGSNVPFGGFNLFLLENFPIPFLSVRAAYEKFGILIVMGYVILLFILLTDLNFKNNFRRNTYSFLLFLLIMALGFPMWTGKIHENKLGVRPSATINIPGDYYDVAEILREDNSSLSISLPMPQTTWMSSNWNGGRDGYFGSDILRLLSDTPIISTLSGNQALDDLDSSIEKELISGNPNAYLLNNRNIKYLVVRKDANYKWIKSYTKRQDSIQHIIDRIDNLEFLEKFYESKNFILYRVANTDLNTLIDSNGSVEDFRFINPAKYEIDLRFKNEEDSIVFRRTFNENWNLYHDKQKKDSFFSKIKNSDLQYLFAVEAAGFYHDKSSPIFLNKWIFEKNDVINNNNLKQDSLDMSLVLIFKPQLYFYLGLAISSLSLILAVLVALINIKKWKSI